MAQAAPEYRDPPPSARPSARDGAVVETATEARQGVTGHGVRYVLFISLAAVIVAFAAIYLGFFSA